MRIVTAANTHKDKQVYLESKLSPYLVICISAATIANRDKPMTIEY